MNQPLPPFNTPKFRPVLSAAQISHILTLCRGNPSAMSIEIIQKLSMFEYKVSNEIVKPAYVSTPIQSLAESCGFDSVDHHPTVINVSEISSEVLYNLWLKEPSALTVSQLKTVQNYRYEQNKMTIDEEKNYEREVLRITV